MKKRFKVLIALSLTVPIALLFLMADSFTPDTVQAKGKPATVDISSPAAAVGYGLPTVRLCVNQTKKVKAAGRQELADNVSVDDPTIASATLELHAQFTLLRITGKKAGTTTVRWKIGVTPFSRAVVVRKCGNR